ncbi:hypothetical protein FZC84_17235 [Rossellomorea vietnamensis]|uniref:Uncharacterized protein n=1 Tax=Rossellomorea vietnamensis TaxID=218284 RepID=A0A5D4M8E8_9BACI|nr:hypothetical protein [Rossellomorea vietnamensis]TYR97942.1 hypothetical protein FZC84_17235 [Rossellomorea vietnamensis]
MGSGNSALVRRSIRQHGIRKSSNRCSQKRPQTAWNQEIPQSMQSEEVADSTELANFEIDAVRRGIRQHGIRKFRNRCSQKRPQTAWNQEIPQSMQSEEVSDSTELANFEIDAVRRGIRQHGIRKSSNRCSQKRYQTAWNQEIPQSMQSEEVSDSTELANFEIDAVRRGFRQHGIRKSSNRCSQKRQQIEWNHLK